MRHTIWQAAIILFASCSSQGTKYPHLCKITDDSLANTILSYVDSTSLNPKERYIAVKGIFSNGRTEYQIAAGRSSKDYRISSPDHFATLNDIVVIFWLTDGETLELNLIQDEIDNMVKEKGIRLESEIMNYDPPLWKLSKDGGQYRLVTKPEDIFQ
jgi:hypothetical protein